ncbi:hypothetical protein [Silvanigrella aquatica]|uniref:Uncharacterized protein n=1 Tax=Silvanigrella aquatica TaxID=1915309 RepID=A0A1L4D4Y5_9BACT|nr:hypothetical protein [Silvanigrella aquatica]APJ05275.1 hypothetical protein AXG55_14735 [Silvanigrella aquatica]
MTSSPAQLKQKYKPKYTGYVGGRFIYYRLVPDLNGELVPQRCNRTDNPELQSTYLYNQDGSEVLRYIRLDIDAEKTIDSWKDENGVVSWTLISRELEKYPGIKRQIEKVILSRSKRGIHILIGLAPLPLISESIQAQLLARKIQSNLITCFNELGIGADPAGRGLKLLFSTYRNHENLVHSNQILTKNIEKSAKKLGAVRVNYLNNLNNACEEMLEKLGIKRGNRLYPDLRLEVKIARLFLFVLGMYQPIEINSTLFENKVTTDQDYLNNISYAKINTVELNYEQIAEIMATEKRNIYGKFWDKKEIKELFNIDKTIDNTIRISVKETRNLHKMIQRALSIWNYQPSELKLNLIRPENVLDGSRNSAIVSWALAMKWSGIDSENALKCLTEMVKIIPDCENAKKSCKKSQLKATINSIYRNRRELEGWIREELPEWISEYLPCNLAKKAATPAAEGGYTISLSRNIQACRLSTDLLHIKKFYILRSDGFLYFHGKYYSCGLKHSKKKVKLLILDNMIHVYGFEDNLKIAVHKINTEKYKKFSVLEEHELDVEEIFLFNQNYILKAKSISGSLSLFIQSILCNMKGFSDNKFICAMLSIKKKYDFSSRKIEQLFAYCLENRIFGYRKIIEISRSM